MADPVDQPPVIRERLIERNGNGNGGWARFKDAIFLAVVLGAGAVIWEQQQTIDQIKVDIAVLKLVCGKQPVERGARE